LGVAAAVADILLKTVTQPDEGSDVILLYIAGTSREFRMS